MANAFNGDMPAMFSAEGAPLEDRKPALAAMLAFGLDLFHARDGTGDGPPRRWSSGAGQSPGQFLPPVFAAVLQGDEKQ